MATFQLPHLHDGEHPHLQAAVHAFWAACGAIVLAFIFLAALGAIDPADAVELTVVVVALAVLWLAHSWREQWRAEQDR